MPFPMTTAERLSMAQLVERRASAAAQLDAANRSVAAATREAEAVERDILEVRQGAAEREGAPLSATEASADLGPDEGGWHWFSKAEAAERLAAEEKAREEEEARRNAPPAAPAPTARRTRGR